jgi:hypothetical protein
MKVLEQGDNEQKYINEYDGEIMGTERWQVAFQMHF